MPDKIFFPLIALLGLGMAFIAIQTGGGQVLPRGSVSAANTDYKTVIVDGANLHRIIAGGPSDISINQQAGAWYVRIEADATKPLAAAPLNGPHFRLAADIQEAFAGHMVAVTIRARPSSKYGASGFSANYSTGRAGDSGWQSFDMNELAFTDYTFEVRVPPSTGAGVDYFGIHPVVPEKRRAVEVERVTFRKLGRWNADDGA